MGCHHCGVGGGVLGALGLRGTATYEGWRCPQCTVELERVRLQSQADSDNKRKKAEQLEAKRVEAAMKNASGVLVTSTPDIDGHRVRKYLGLESVEIVVGTGVFSEVITGVQDLFGLRSSSFERKLQKAKSVAVEALQVKAALKGGNAVVAVDLDYTEFSNNRIGLILSGTVVQVVAAS